MKLICEPIYLFFHHYVTSGQKKYACEIHPILKLYTTTDHRIWTLSTLMLIHHILWAQPMKQFDAQFVLESERGITQGKS